MRYFVVTLFYFVPLITVAEPCGSTMGIGGSTVGVSNDICMSEANELMNNLRSGNYKTRKGLELKASDLNTVIFIHRQKRAPFYRCNFNGYLIVTNVEIKEEGNRWRGAKSTAICVKKRRRGLQVYSIERNVEGVPNAFML